MNNKWQVVKFAGDSPECECCGEPWCEEHDTHLADCDCIGPTEDDCEYKEVDGVLYGRRTAGKAD